MPAIHSFTSMNVLVVDGADHINELTVCTFS